MDIRDSLAKILNDPDIFAARFYPRFFKLCPEAEKHFEGVDMDRQAILLNQALISLTDGYLHHFLTTLTYLAYLGRDHEKWGIPKSMFKPFGEALLGTLQSYHGEEWDEDLQEQWQQAIARTTEVMLNAYQNDSGNP